jgi:exosortase family protein XrtF
MNIAEVKPALRFLGIFLGCYIVLSVLYGFWIESLGKVPDAMTSEVSREVVAILNTLGVEASQEPNPSGPTVFVFDGAKKVLNVFEGCNGLNVMIVFLSFVLAYGGRRERVLWFIPAGFLVIHLANLGRILWLFWLSAFNERLFYYFHKYFFTAAIYVIVFMLWWFWVTRWNGTSSVRHAS